MTCEYLSIIGNDRTMNMCTRAQVRGSLRSKINKKL